MIYQLIIYLFVNSFIHSFIHFSCDASGRRVGAEWPADQRDVYGRHRQTGLRRHRFRLPVGGCLHDGCRPRHQTRPGFRQDVPIAADQSKGRDHRNGTGEQQREDLKLLFTRSFHGARFFYCLYNRTYLNVDEIPASVVYKLTYLIYKFCHTLW